MAEKSLARKIAECVGIGVLAGGSFYIGKESIDFLIDNYTLEKVVSGHRDYPEMIRYFTKTSIDTYNIACAIGVGTGTAAFNYAREYVKSRKEFISPHHKNPA